MKIRWIRGTSRPLNLLQRVHIPDVRDNHIEALNGDRTVSSGARTFLQLRESADQFLE